MAEYLAVPMLVFGGKIILNGSWFGSTKYMATKKVSKQ
jgi:hypothetical protein